MDEQILMKSPTVKRYSITIPGTTDSLSILRGFVMDTACRAGLTETEAGKLEIAVCEACANIVEHAYGKAMEKIRDRIAVNVAVAPSRIVVTINDYAGECYPVTEMRRVSVEEFLKSDRKRGLGTYIIHAFVDKVEHAFTPSRGNRLRLTKYR